MWAVEQRPVQQEPRNKRNICGLRCDEKPANRIKDKKYNSGIKSVPLKATRHDDSAAFNRIVAFKQIIFHFHFTAVRGQGGTDVFHQLQSSMC